MSIGLVAQRGNERAQTLAAEVRESLDEVGVDVRLDEATGEALDRGGVPVAAMAECTLVASIGGDGTFLYAAGAIEDTPIVGVNLGEVGFLNVVAPAAATETIRSLHRDAVEGSLRSQELPRVVARVGQRVVGPALNEIVVHGHQRGRPGGVTVDIAVNGEPYHTDRVDGVMVSTPTGSTAYNLSEDGPLLSPTTQGLVINEMCGRDPMPPLVVPLESTVEIAVTEAPFGYIIGDGRQRERVDVPVDVAVEVAETPTRIAGPPLAFFAALGKLD